MSKGSIVRVNCPGSKFHGMVGKLWFLFVPSSEDKQQRSIIGHHVRLKTCNVIIPDHQVEIVS